MNLITVVKLETSSNIGACLDNVYVCYIFTFSGLYTVYILFFFSDMHRGRTEVEHDHYIGWMILSDNSGLSAYMLSILA